MRSGVSNERPPRLARRLLTILVGADAADETLAGLGELFRIRVGRDGEARARRWYWRQVLAFAPRYRSVRPRKIQHAGSLLQDIGFALRVLGKAPVFSFIAVITLALGIGASLAMFGIVNATLIRPLPYAEADRLVIGRATFDGDLNPYVAAPDYVDYRDGADTFHALAAILPFAGEVTVTGANEPERVTITTASTNFFSALGVAPLLGRSFREDEGTEAAANVLVVSYRYWQTRLGAAPDVLGQSLNLGGVPYTVIGVMRPDFHFLLDVDFWRPMRPDRDASSLRDRHNWFVLGRLAPGATIEQAQSNVDVISAELRLAYPESNSRKALLLTDLRSVLVEDYRVWLGILTASALLVLLIACANVAGMILARAPARRQELSVRAALGADGFRLMRQLLAESVTLSVTGGLLGLALASGMQGAVLAFLRMDRLGLGEIEISTPMTAVALVLSVGTGLVAGLYPAIRSSRSNLADELKRTTASVGGGGTVFRSGLVVAQIAISVVLLVGSGLMIRSLLAKQAVDPGFDPIGVITAEIQLPTAADPRGRTPVRFFTQLVEEVGAEPGVVSVSEISHVPIKQPFNTFRVKGPDTPPQGERVFLRAALPGYFEIMGIPVVAGRDFESSDGAGGNNAAIVSQSLARKIFGAENPLGREVELDQFGSPRNLQVGGVVGDVQIGGLTMDPGVTLYLPEAPLQYGRMQLVVRAAGDPTSVAGSIRSRLRGLNSNIPLSELTTMEAVVSDSLSDHSIIAPSLTIYALFPLLFAAVGLYAVVATYVGQRLHEIGIRMVLGAEPSRIGVWILGRGLVLVGVGLTIGVAGAFAGSRVLRQMLFGIQPTDPVTIVLVAGLVLVIALVAGAVPVVRAVRSDPKAVLQAR